MRSHLDSDRSTARPSRWRTALVGATTVAALVALGLAPGAEAAGAAEAVPRVVPGLATVAEGNAGTTVVEVPVTLSAPTDVAVTVDWATIYGPGVEPPSAATPGDDVTASSGTVTFAPGDTAESIAIEIHGDTTAEPDDYVVASFTNPQNARIGGYWGLGFAIIDDDDTRPTIRTEPVDVTEGDVGTTVMSIPVSLSSPFGAPVSVDWTTVTLGLGSGMPAEATAGVDYTATSGTVRFDPYQTRATMDIVVTGDATIEPDEVVLVNLSNPVNGTITSSPPGRLGIGTILNDDAPPVRTLTIEPAPPVAGGDRVVVRGTNWTPGASMGLCQGVAGVSPTAAPGAGCFAGAGTPYLFTADDQGGFAVEVDVHRWGYAGAIDVTADCTEAVPGCVIGAAELDDYTNTVTVTPLPLSPPPSAPTTPGQVTVTPSTDLADGDPVTIEGTGFRPDAVIDLHQCIVVPVFVGPAGCEWGTRERTTADAAGAFSFTFDVTREAQGIDCASRTCYLVASEAVDFVGTYVASPIAFAPPP
jgi:hypothetical protein